MTNLRSNFLKSALLTLCLLTGGQTSFASFSSDDNGTSGAAFLSLGIGARALAMGGAYTTMTQGADSLFWNPAGLAKNRSIEVMLNHQPFLDSLDYNVGSLAIPFKNSSLALGYAGLQYDDIDALDRNGNKTGSFEANDQLFALGYGTNYNNVQLGGSAKFIRSSIEKESASAYAVDLGIGFSNPLTKRLSHAFVAQNIGSEIKFESEGDSLPLVFKLGSQLSIAEPWALSLDINFPKDSEISGGIGTEYALPVGEKIGLALRAGYTTQTREIGDISGLGLGGGLSLSGLTLDFAWVPNENLGTSQIFTISYQFGK